LLAPGSSQQSAHRDFRIDHVGVLWVHSFPV
jgi:hypothetical protein